MRCVVETPAQEPAEKPGEQPSEKPAEQPAEKPAQQVAENSSDSEQAMSVRVSYDFTCLLSTVAVFEI